MFLKLTNAVEQHKGDTLLINTSKVVSIYSVGSVTRIYSTPAESWDVQEPIAAIASAMREELIVVTKATTRKGKV